MLPSTGNIILIAYLSSENLIQSITDRTKLSKALITDASKIEWRTPADLKIKYNTTLRTDAVSS